MCDAVAHAHAKGVIHRDLKPSNVFVLDGDAHPTIKVLDFGLARITDAEGAGWTRVTEHGTLRGTLAYMSPEQLSGDPEAVDVRSDVYALGVLLYELLTDTHPFGAGAEATFDLPRRILHDRPRPISRSWAPAEALDSDLTTIVMKCLEKEPSRRYPTVQALSEDLRRWRTGQPIAARPPSTAYQLRKMIARNRVGFAVILAASAILLGLTAGLAILASHLTDERDRANREAEAARANAAAFASVLLHRSPTFSATRLDDPDAVAALIEEIADRSTGDLAGQVRVLREAGAAIFESGSFASGVRFLERANAIARTIDHGWAAGSLRMTLGEMYHRYGRIAEAETIFRDIVEILRSSPEGRNPRGLGYAVENLGCAERDLGRLDEAESLLREALYLYSSAPVPYPGLLASAHDSLGNLYLAGGDLAAAEAEHRAALALREGDSHETSPPVKRSRMLLGIVLVRRGKLDEAEPLLRDAVAGCEARLGPEHPDTAAALVALGELEQARGRTAAARADFERAALVYANRLSVDHPSAVALRERMGEVGAP